MNYPNTTPAYGLILETLTFSASGNIVPSLPPLVQLARPLIEERAHNALVLAMASFWSFVGWLQYLFCLLLGWYLVYCFMRRCGNPPGVSGCRKGLTDLAFASFYPYLDLLIRYFLTHFCPDLSSPWISYILSPWLARLAGYAALTLGLLVLRLIVFVSGRLAYYGKYFIQAIQRRDQWYHTTLYVDLLVRLFWAVWYGGYNALYNLQVIGYRARDRTGGRWGDIVSGLRLVMQSLQSIQKAARRAGLPHDPEGVDGINLLLFDIIYTQYKHLVGPQHEIRRGLSALFDRMYNQVQLFTSLGYGAEMYHFTKALHSIFFQERLAYPTQARLTNIPRTWYAFVFDVLGGTRVLAEARYVKNLFLVKFIEWVVIPLKRFLKWNSEVLCPLLLNNLVPFASLAVLLKIIYRHPIKALVGMVGGLVGGLLIRLTYVALLWLYRRFTFVRRDCSICNEIIEYGESAEQLAACHGHEMHHQCLLHWAANGNPEFTGAGGRGCPICRGPVNLDGFYFFDLRTLYISYIVCLLACLYRFVLFV